jgi:hypothetical protein
MKYSFDTWQNGTSRHMLSAAVAAGLLADGETITVAAIADGPGHGMNKGEPVPGMSLVLWVNPLAGEPGEPRYVMRWASGSLVYPGPDETGALHRVVATAGRIAALAERLRDDEDAADALAESLRDGAGADEPDEVPALDRVIAEVADALGRYAGLDSNGLALDRHQALGLARAAMSRLCLIRDRDGIDPLPHRDVPATEPGYDPVTDLAVVALAAMRTAMPSNPTASTGLLRLQRNLGVDGTTAYPAVVLALRAALEAQHADR